MSYAALIERFDRHMSRIDEELRLSREAAERHAEMHERHAAMYEDTREFIREMTLRMHRDSDATIASLNANTEAFRTEMLDQRAQLRANTAAVLKMLDRLDDDRPRRGD
ncbi:MAG: hypothetical protein WC558_07005 [Patulibacter sp.]